MKTIALSNGGSEGVDKMVLVFKNYVPKSKDLKELVQKTEGVPSRDADFQVEEAKKAARQLPDGDKPVLIAPKRANWDLKRDVEKRMKKLSKRTQKALVEIAEELNSNAAEDS